jgi:hypothetical protein
LKRVMAVGAVPSREEIRAEWARVWAEALAPMPIS